MDKNKLTGVIPSVVIPLTSKKSIDLEAFHKSIYRMLEAGVDGLFFLGSCGEVAHLTDAQRYHVLSEAVSIVNGRVPILAGIIDMETLRVVDQAKRASSYGVDGLVATAPFYTLGGSSEVERHFRAIRDHTSLPLFAYDLPACTMAKLDPALLVRLGCEGVLQGVKDSSGDDANFRWLVQENKDAGSPLALFAGRDMVLDGAYLAGADGCIPGLANVCPGDYVAQWAAARAGNWQEVANIQDKLSRLMWMTRDLCCAGGLNASIGAFKTALWQMGIFNTNEMREPVSPLCGKDVEVVASALKIAGLLDADAPVREDFAR